MKMETHILLDNEIRKAIQVISLSLIQGHVEEKKLRSIRSQLYRDLELIDSSVLCSGGPLSMHLFRQIANTKPEREI